MTIDEKVQEYFDKNFTYNQVYKQGVIDGYNKAIDDFYKELQNNGLLGVKECTMRNRVNRIIAKLKKGINNE